VRTQRHPSIRPGLSCFASRGRGRGRGLGVAVGAAVGTAVGTVAGVAVGVGTAVGAAVGPPNLPIPLAGRYGYWYGSPPFRSRTNIVYHNSVLAFVTKFSERFHRNGNGKVVRDSALLVQSSARSQEGNPPSPLPTGEGEM
jgi:hypothetical protein